MTYIVLGEKVKGAEHLVVLEVKGPGGLEVSTECRHVGGLDYLLWAADGPELPVVVAAGEPRSPARPAAMVVVV